MVVISDTSAISNLWQIGQIEILKLLYNTIIIPTAVQEELFELEDQQVYLQNCDWINVQPTQNLVLTEVLQAELDEGEAQAIALSVEMQPDFLIIDELKGREKARSLGIKIIGLLGVLVEAKRAGIISQVNPILIDLTEKVNFFISPQLRAEILAMVGE